MYCVRRLKLGISEQLERLALAAGELYSKTLVSFWRVVRKKGLWLKSASLMRSAEYNKVANQKIHQMSSGQLRQMLTDKAKRLW